MERTMVHPTPPPDRGLTPLRELRGVVERITYQNPENGYTVARLTPERAGLDAEVARGDDRLVTVVGTLADLTPGEAIIAHGWWRNDPKHGWQFQARDYRTTLPATLQGMRKYLGSGLIKGVGPEARAGGRVYRPGDCVLQLRNDYDLQVFNGDLGTVRAVDPVEQELTLALDDGREVRYPYVSLFALTHAYALSVHKAQGGEFPAVVLPLLTSHAVMLGRTLVYTAFTRARRLVVLVGQPKALRLAVRDWRREPRHTALADLLTGTRRFGWPRGTTALGEAASPANPSPWEGLLDGPSAGDV
jgi:ATP-dependent exoDNAse (exonuclease V) alpha subunit